MRQAIVFVALLLVVPTARAEEDWTRHEMGAASVTLPTAWVVRHDPSNRWLSAVDPSAPFVTVLLERVDVAATGASGAGPARCRAFADAYLAKEKAATRAGVGFHVEKTGEGEVSSRPACWTLVAKPGGMPERVSLYLHVRVDDIGYALRIDVPREAYAERRGILRRIVDSLLLGDVVVSPEEGMALARVLDALAADPPETRREYHAWLHELDLVGPSARPHMKGLARRYVEGIGWDDRTVRAFLGDRRFEGSLPEVISFRGHAFLRAVEKADAKRWFRATETEAWARTQEARRLANLHAERLVSDRRYRAGDQVFANLGLASRFQRSHLVFLWADPYALVFVSDRARADAPALLEERARRLQRTYRAFLDRYGESLGLHDLMEPWGGRPDYREGARSFPDGAPLPVLVFGDRDSFVDTVSAQGFGPWSRPMPRTLLQGDGTLLLRVDAEGAGERSSEVEVGATMQFLHWFTRQQSKWRGPPMGPSAFADGFEEWFAADTLQEGELWLLRDMRKFAAAFADRIETYPVFPLADLLGFASTGQIEVYAATRWRLPTPVALRHFRHQAWALVHMLNEGHGAKYHEPFLTWMDAVLQRETQHGMSKQVFKRVFGLRDEGDWDAFEAMWQAYVRELVGDVSHAAEEVDPAAAPFDLVILHQDEKPTEVLLQRADGSVLSRATFISEPAPLHLLDLILRLDSLEDLGPERRAIRIRHRPAKGPFPPWKDMRLILLALLMTGHEDITFEGPTLPEARAFLDAWD